MSERCASVAVEVDLVETVLVDAVFFDLRLFLVLYGLAAGARLIGAVGVGRGVSGRGVVLLLQRLCVGTRLAETARSRRAAARRRNNIYCTPMGLAAFPAEWRSRR